jgi:hypothetical protein
MEITKLSFTGSPDEFAAVEHLFWSERDESEQRHELVSKSEPRVRFNSPPAGATVFGRDTEGKTPEDYHRLLTRLPVPEAQQQIYKALYKAGDKGLTAGELEARIRRKRSELPGIMGALGRRVNSTPGIGVTKKPGISLLFDIAKLNNGAGEWHYKMSAMLREVLELLHPEWLQSEVT